jgi:hypothetical protein
MMAVNEPTHSRRAYRLLGVGDAYDQLMEQLERLGAYNSMFEQLRALTKPTIERARAWVTRSAWIGAVSASCAPSAPGRRLRKRRP